MSSIPASAFEAGAARLRQTGGPARDASAPKLSGFISDSDVASHQGRMLDLNIEEWLPLIREHTFETEYVPIDEEGASLLAEAHDEWEELVKLHRMQHGSIGEAELSRLQLSDSTREKLRQMGSELQIAINRMAGDGGGVFVKTSSRSAKDAPVFSFKMRRLMAKFLEHSEDTLNNRLVALLQAATDMLRMTSAEEVLESFVRSQRICDDMRLALDLPDRFRENFVVRKWVNISVDQEYRAFVYNNKMTAICQYNHMLKSDRVITRGEEIMKSCEAFWAAELRDKLRGKLDSYVIDFAVCGEEFSDRQAIQNGPRQIWVIELNPFETTTDGALFSWTQEKDLLQGERAGVKDLQIRVQDRVPANGVKAAVAVEWRELLDLPISQLVASNHA